MKKLLGLYIVSCALFCQTRIDLNNQGKNVDFSNAVSTKPVRTGTVIPAVCVLGELFFKTNAPAGSNLYACVGANTWVSQSSTGGVPPVVGNPASVLVSDGISAYWVGLSGDVSGAANSIRVDKIQNRPVAGTAPLSGQALVWNSTSTRWEPQTVSGAGGSVSWETSGAAVGTRSVANMVAGPGLLNIVSDTGAKINIQQSLDTAVVVTKSAHQSGSGLYCQSTTNSAVAYRCVMSPTLTAYTTPMVLFWKPDVDGAAGAVTLGIDGLGTKAVKLIDGISDPLEGDIRTGVLLPVWYDGVQFRLLVGSTAPRLKTGARPACASQQRGQLWHVFGSTGQKDAVAVCAKDASEGYDWRGIY